MIKLMWIEVLLAVNSAQLWLARSNRKVSELWLRRGDLRQRQFSLRKVRGLS